MDVNHILTQLKRKSTPMITVFGDYCLDKYLHINAELNEASLETGLTAYQVVKKRLYAGAAGTITNNLRALGAKVFCIGLIGDDGEGFELLRCLDRVGANTSLMIKVRKRSTCTYLKPIYCERKVEDQSGSPFSRHTEMNRYDFKNYELTSCSLQMQLIENLKKAVRFSDAVIVCDQFTEKDCSVVTEAVRGEIAELAEKNPKVIFYADSRAYIHKFRNVIAKCNLKEITDIFGEKENLTKDCLFGLAERLFTMIHKPVYITLGEQGSIVYDGNRHKVDAVKVGGAIDSVGAGDACNAGIVFALVKGADYEQAALVGNVAASLVIRQIGQTGAARFEDVVAVLEGITSEKCF